MKHNEPGKTRLALADNSSYQTLISVTPAGPLRVTVEILQYIPSEDQLGSFGDRHNPNGV